MFDYMTRGGCVEELKYRNSMLARHSRNAYPAQADHKLTKDDFSVRQCATNRIQHELNNKKTRRKQFLPDNNSNVKTINNVFPNTILTHPM